MKITGAGDGETGVGWNSANDGVAGLLITAVGIVKTELEGKLVGTDVAGIITKVVVLIVIIVTDFGTDDDLTKTGDDGNEDFGGKTMVSRTVVEIAGGIAVVGTVKT